jgi:hypothetical protein
VCVCVFVCLPALCSILFGLRKMNQPLRILSFLNFWGSDFDIVSFTFLGEAFHVWRSMLSSLFISEKNWVRPL